MQAHQAPMEGHWLILGRVLRVVPAEAQAQAEHAVVVEPGEAPQALAEHAAVVEPGQAEQAVQEEQAAVGEAQFAAQMEHAAAREAEVDAQAEQAAVRESEDAAQVEHAAAAGEAEVAAQAEQAVVGGAEDSAAGEAEVTAQAEQAASGEAEDAAQVEHAAAAGEAVVAALQAQLEERVTEVDRAAAEAAAAQAGHGHGAAAAAPDFTISVAPPPRVTFLTAGESSHPDPTKPDMYPYIIASGRFCLLARFSTHPYRGTSLNDRPRASHLVVVRHFRNGATDGQIAATAERVPSRTRDVPVLNNVEGVGFLCNDEDRSYRIAELRVITGPYHSASLVCFRSGGGGRRWFKRELDTPLPLRGDRVWEPHGAVAIGNNVIWFDLSWGMLARNLDRTDRRLDFYGLPPGRALDSFDSKDNIHTRRCIAVSGNILRYVEIIVPNNGEAEAPTVCMWYRGRGGQWYPNYTVSFQDIWNHQSYTATELPQNVVPDLVSMSPVNPSVVYFALEQRLFGVRVPDHVVVHCENYELVDVPRLPRQASGRYIVTWNLHPGQEYNVGYVSKEPIVTLPEDFSDDEVVQDRKGTSKTTTWGRRHSKSVNVSPMKVRRRQ